MHGIHRCHYAYQDRTKTFHLIPQSQINLLHTLRQVATQVYHHWPLTILNRFLFYNIFQCLPIIEGDYFYVDQYSCGWNIADHNELAAFISCQ